VILRPRLLDGETLLVELSEPMRAISTTVYGGGLGWVDSAIFRHVDRCFSDPSPQEYARRIAEDLGRERSAVFLTAADVGDYIYVGASGGGVRVELVSTIGLTHPACIGLEPPGGSGPSNPIGTINMMLATDAGLSDVGLIDLFRSASEAKAGAISILGLSCGGLPAVGTVSDATAVASRPGSRSYAGLGTLVGYLASTAVLEAIRVHMSRRGAEDYLRYMGYRGGDGAGGLPSVLVKRLSLLLEQLRRTKLVPWIGDGVYGELEARLEGLGGGSGQG